MPYAARPPLDRLMEKIRVDSETNCWIWTAALDRKGYGVFMHHKAVRAHRAAYELLVAPIPAGLQLDHLCRNPPCVNPAHLEPVTPAENSKRGRAATATHCKRGHERTAENTYVTTIGRRRCRVCMRDYMRQWYLDHRKRA